MEINEKNLTVIEVRIRLLRDIKGLTQEELSRELNVSRALINSWENGYAEISLKKLVCLSFFFEVPIDYIIGLTTKYDKNIYDFKSEIDLKYLGKKIRIIRKSERLTQIEFASMVHIERSSLSHYENGFTSISTSDLKEICNNFGFSADWCIGNTHECIRRNKKVIINESEFNEFINI